MEGNKKRKRSDDMDVDEDNIDEYNLENQIPGEIVNVEFEFSNIKEDDFHIMKSLLTPMFQFEKSINIAELADCLIKQNQDVGTTIRNESQIFGLFSYVPLTIPFKKQNHSIFIDQFFNYLENKINKYIEDINKRNIKKYNISFVISERVLNLAEETIPPALGFATKEIIESRDVETDEKTYDNRFEFDYLIVISKFVKFQDNVKHGKKAKLDEIQIKYENEAYYKFEFPLFLEKSLMQIEYKIPYKENKMEMLEHKKEPQYIKIIMIKAKDYYDILLKKLGCKFE